MKHFRKLVSVSERIIKFSFSEVITTKGPKYAVDTVKEGKYFSFDMAIKNEKWAIVHAPQPPQWIIDVENVLANAIHENIFLFKRA